MIHAVVCRIAEDGEMDTATYFFRSNTTLEMTNCNIPILIVEAFAKMNSSFEKFAQQGSGWA